MCLDIRAKNKSLIPTKYGLKLNCSFTDNFAEDHPSLPRLFPCVIIIFEADNLPFDAVGLSPGDASLSIVNLD